MILQDQQCSFFYLLHIPIDSTLFIVTQMVVIIQVLDPNINAIEKCFSKFHRSNEQWNSPLYS